MRILLDTNVWNYLAEEQAGDQLVNASVRSGNEVLVAPTVLYESLGTTDPARRKQLVDLQLHRRWRRLLPEVYHECREVFAEIKRLRPGWVDPSPDLRNYRANLADWKRDKPGAHNGAQRGFWGRVRTECDVMAEHTRFPRLGQAREETRAARDAVAQSGQKLPPTLEGVLAAPLLDAKRQVKGREAEAWRWAALRAWDVHLSTPGSPHDDWFKPFIAGRPWTHDRAAWTDFWLEEARRESLPRAWSRWACEELQLHRKWTSGTPGDSQLASHLVDADALVTADKNLGWIVEEIRACAPVQTARAVRVPGGREGVSAVIDLVGGAGHHG